MMNLHLKRLKGVRYLFNQPLSSYTSMQVGGLTPLILEPEDQEALARLIAYLKRKEVEWYLLGGGSNIIFGEDGFQGVVIRLGAGFRFLERIDELHFHVGAAHFLPLLLEKIFEAGLSGLEFCYGIPGTLGGAVAGNAGMDGLGVLDMISQVNGVTRWGDAITLHEGDYSYGYRRVDWRLFDHGSPGEHISNAKDKDLIVTSVILRLKKADTEIRRALIMKYKAMRSRQPATRGAAGSIFKNPSGDFAGRLIEAAGLKGRVIGGAIVSPAHANWIINRGNASAKDVLDLISIIQKRVFRRFGVRLEPEVKIVGAPSFKKGRIA